LGIVGFGAVTTLVTTGATGGTLSTAVWADAVAGYKALLNPAAPRTSENDMPSLRERAVAVGKYRRLMYPVCPLVVKKPVNPY
jgi:hypothetical protein